MFDVVLRALIKIVQKNWQSLIVVKNMEGFFCDALTLFHHKLLSESNGWRSLSSHISRGLLTTFQSMMNAKLIQQRFWHCCDNGLIKTIQTMPSYLRVDSKHWLCDSEQCRKRKESVLKIKTHAEDVTVTLFKNLDIHRYGGSAYLLEATKPSLVLAKKSISSPHIWT